VVKFWDTSALIPLIVNEARTAHYNSLLERDSDVAVWWGTEVECWSALSRAQRRGSFDAQMYEMAAAALDVLRRSWFEISPSDEVRREARRLLRIHPLRAADALQLGAALVWSGRYEGYDFISTDEKLRDAARLEGFMVA
jgi:hypothetical protein